ncbi:hypothetical protein [Rhodopirellula sp. MGV]|uniref:hypothetical protein n=1 Tax=Rhodopirellula sp. MGV TaxID=2023130 RepID=UPI000B961F71|nr:hypothetical protein [Rhodopirellula sp. MGV]OYP38905.1 hypothetical protein CGZ80_01410 [Rhodopirellula sp. MGV]PNY38281.1 hypothetical protein C2E31_02925 [Rhodopirellula baltica]
MSLATTSPPTSQTPTRTTVVVSEAERRSEAIQRFLAEETATQRLVGDRAVVDRIIHQLTREGWSEAAIGRVLDARLSCIFELLAAGAACSRIAIENGVVVVEGTQAEWYRRRLARFNHVLRPHNKSVAAFYQEKLSQAE